MLGRRPILCEILDPPLQRQTGEAVRQDVYGECPFSVLSELVCPYIYPKRHSMFRLFLPLPASLVLLTHPPLRRSSQLLSPDLFLSGLLLGLLLLSGLLLGLLLFNL